ncbi:MAG: amidase [Halothiobacillus sp. 20-54-6]|nr:MAG: amidase [Halothiobacillus sp. 20-54-6]
MPTPYEILRTLNVSSPQTQGTSLRGLRVGVKDLFDIAGVPTSAGNPDWLATHSVPTQTASAVQRLLDAGAVVVAKTLTDELAYSLNGVNAHYGTPINAAAPDRIPGGSSSGSAVMVATDKADIGLGTGGSIRVPASYNGLLGLRPTHGVIAVDHLVGLAPSFDTVGWMTRDLATLHRVASVLLPLQPGVELRDLCVLKPQFYGKSLWREQAQQWLTPRLPQFNSVREIVLAQAFLQFASQTFRTLQGFEIWQTHGEWIHSTQPRFAPDIAERFVWCQKISPAQRDRAGRDRLEIVQTLSHWLSGDQTVALLPTTSGAAPLLNEPAQNLAQYRLELMGLTALAGLSSRPQLHLPVLRDQTAPWGLSLMGEKHADSALIALAKNLLEPIYA